MRLHVKLNDLSLNRCKRGRPGRDIVAVGRQHGTGHVTTMGASLRTVCTIRGDWQTLSHPSARRRPMRDGPRGAACVIGARGPCDRLVRGVGARHPRLPPSPPSTTDARIEGQGYETAVALDGARASMRVIRSTYGDAAEWRTQRRALEEARAAGAAAGGPHLAELEPAVVVSGPEDHAEGPGVLVEAVGPDGGALYRCRVVEDGRGAPPDEAIEAAIQEAWRHLVRHVGPSDEEPAP